MNTTDSHQLISRAYQSFYPQLVGFISRKVSNSEDAKDIAQDVFVRLLSYDKEIREENIRNLLFTVAANLTNDYLRHIYVLNDVHSHILTANESWVNDTEERVIGRDLVRMEKVKLDTMPNQRRLIYFMRVHEGKTSQEVADKLGISKRTAENHFYIGITQMREYMRACV